MLGVFVYYFYRILFALWRINLVEHPTVQKLLAERSPLILAHWHGDELALIHLVSRYKLATMTSTSKDGQLVNYVIHRLGGDTSRGSSTRGGVSALKGLVRLLRSGRATSVAVDGPRGPIYQPKPGVFELSKLGHAHIVPVGVVARPVHVFQKAWNKAFLPLPFARVSIYFAEPLPPVGENSNPKDLLLAKELTLRLDAAKQQAAKIIATL